MTLTQTCARCGGTLEGLQEQAAAPPSALFGDLCLGCLDAIWDVVMERVGERRKSAGPS
jgi:hypothetical protein